MEKHTLSVTPFGARWAIHVDGSALFSQPATEAEALSLGRDYIEAVFPGSTVEVV